MDTERPEGGAGVSVTITEEVISAAITVSKKRTVISKIPKNIVVIEQKLLTIILGRFSVTSEDVFSTERFPEEQRFPEDSRATKNQV